MLLLIYLKIDIIVLFFFRKSVSLCRQLEQCGVSFITVHGRTPTQRFDEVNINALRVISDSVHCPVIANGGVKNLDEAMELHTVTRCKGKINKIICHDVKIIYFYF